MNFISSVKPEKIDPAAVQKAFLELCERQHSTQIRLVIVERNLKKCAAENINLELEVKSARDADHHAAEKLRRISSLCLDLRKGLGVSATQKAIEDERAKQKELNDAFAIDVLGISKRIEEVALNNQTNSTANECLRLLLTSSIDNFHITETPADSEETSFEAEFLKSEDAIQQLTECSQMDYEDYISHVARLITTQVSLRELLASCNDKFQGFQESLGRNNSIFENHRKNVDRLSERFLSKQSLRSTELLELKAVNKEIKLNSKYVNECKGSLANRRLKENKLLKLIEVFEADISAKELEIASKMIPR